MLNRKRPNMDEKNPTITPGTDTADANGTTEETSTHTDEKAASAEVEKLKRMLSKANSEANAYKQQLREKQTEAERAEAERAEADRRMREELENLRAEKSIANGKTLAMAAGFDGESAAKIATATATLTDDQRAALFDALTGFVQTTTTRLNNEALNRQPGLSTGIPPSMNTAKQTEDDKFRQWMGLGKK